MFFKGNNQSTGRVSIFSYSDEESFGIFIRRVLMSDVCCLGVFHCVIGGTFLYIKVDNCRKKFCRIHMDISKYWLLKVILILSFVSAKMFTLVHLRKSWAKLLLSFFGVKTHRSCLYFESPEMCCVPYIIYAKRNSSASALLVTKLQMTADFVPLFFFPACSTN